MSVRWRHELSSGRRRVLLLAPARVVVVMVTVNECGGRLLDDGGQPRRGPLSGVVMMMGMRRSEVMDGRRRVGHHDRLGVGDGEPWM